MLKGRSIHKIFSKFSLTFTIYYNSRAKFCKGLATRSRVINDFMRHSIDILMVIFCVIMNIFMIGFCHMTVIMPVRLFNVILWKILIVTLWIIVSINTITCIIASIIIVFLHSSTVMRISVASIDFFSISCFRSVSFPDKEV